MKAILRCFIIVCFVLGLLLFWVNSSGYKIILTPSVPPGIWKVSPINRSLCHGDIVWLCPPNTPVFRWAKSRNYLPDGDCPGGYLHMMKPVAAVTGDVVIVTESGVMVNGKQILNSQPMKTDSRGRVLTRYKPEVNHVLPGTVWLVSHYHPQSFDSRYFGSVATRQIQGIGKPIWLFHE